MGLIERLKEHFLFRYDHTQCVIREYSGKTSNSKLVKFWGKSVTLHPGNYQVSCKTPQGYLIKYVNIIQTSNINIRELILNKHQDEHERANQSTSSKRKAKNH